MAWSALGIDKRWEQDVYLIQNITLSKQLKFSITFDRMIAGEAGHYLL